MKKTSIKDIDGDRVTFEQQSWAGFKIATNHCHRAFQNHRGPAVALAVLEASTWGNSFPAKELRALIATMNQEGPELDPESIVDAEVLADPADGFADAVRTALAALTKAGIRQREHEQSRYGSPASLEHAACILTEWIDMDERAAEAERERAARDAQHAAERAATLEDAKLFFASATRVSVPWEDLGVRKQQYWMNVAKAARERYGVSK